MLALPWGMVALDRWASKKYGRTARKSRKSRGGRRGYHTRRGYHVRKFKTGPFKVGRKHSRSRTHRRRQNFVTGKRFHEYDRAGHWVKGKPYRRYRRHMGRTRGRGRR